MVGLIVVLLWILMSGWRHIYQGSHDDISVLADGLLAPGARRQDWFAQGYAHYFDTYPEWPWGLTAFCRPAFQFLVYLAHFAFGRDWASYLLLNYVGAAGASAVAFAIARMALSLGAGAALLAAALVLLSPAVLELSIWQVSYASEILASALVGCGFLAAVTRRDLSGCACVDRPRRRHSLGVWPNTGDRPPRPSQCRWPRNHQCYVTGLCALRFGGSHARAWRTKVRPRRTDDCAYPSRRARSIHRPGGRARRQDHVVRHAVTPGVVAQPLARERRPS